MNIVVRVFWELNGVREDDSYELEAPNVLEAVARVTVKLPEEARLIYLTARPELGRRSAPFVATSRATPEERYRTKWVHHTNED